MAPTAFLQNYQTRRSTPDMIVNAVKEMKAADGPQENEQAIRRLLTTRYHTRNLANPREKAEGRRSIISKRLFL